jgi:hypothetical protein
LIRALLTGSEALRCQSLSGEKIMSVKSVIVVSALVAAIALSACRREEHVPMKLGAGADLPVAHKVAR